MTTDQTFDPSKIITNPQGRLADIHGFSLNMGGQNGSSGAGGNVNVFASGPITTSGLDAHAILAQSIGAGGGAAVGGQFAALRSHAGSGSGDGGTVKIELNPGAKISTSGTGAYGILAQSIGGGGGVAGDFSHAPDHYGTLTDAFVPGGSGDGGVVSVSAHTASVHTTGSYAPAIFAQSIGGGGGLINFARIGDDVQARGTSGGAGTGGPVNINLVNSRVVADGVGSAGILAQSDGRASNPIVISIDGSSLVQGGLTDPKFQSMPSSERDVAAIRLLGGTANEIHNDGTILGDATPSLGTAILANGPARNTTVTNMGSIHGSIILDGTGISLSNLPGGVINAPTTLNLSGGVLQNAGTLHVGGIGTIGTTTLTGDLVQLPTGRVHIDLDTALGRADLLQISGRAALNGSVVVNPISVHKGTSGPVISAAGGLTITPVLEGLAGPVFTHTALVNGNTLSIATDADFKSNDLGKSANQRSVAGHLQRIWDSGAPGFDQGFLSLSRLSSVRAHTQALDNLSGEVHASAITAEVQTAFFVQEAILDRLRFNEGNVFSSGHGLTGTIGSRFAPGTTLPAAYSADLPGNALPSFVPVQPVAPTYALWGQAFGAFGHTNSNGNAGHLSREIGGFMLGVETGAGVLADWRAGVAAGYSVTNFDVTARQSTGSVESGFGAVYARGLVGPLQLRLGAAYAGNTLDTRRAVLLPGLSGVASGKTHGDTVQGFGEVGYRIGLGQSYLEPFVGAAAIHVSRNGFSEVGGAAALSAFGRSYDVETVTAGLQGQAVLSEQLGMGLPIVARGLIGYRRAFGDVEPGALLTFGGGGQGFLTAGVPIARDALVASAGLDVQIAPLVTIGVNYTGQVGDRAQDHAVKGVFSYRW